MTDLKFEMAGANPLGEIKIGVSLFDTEHAQLGSFASRFCEECRSSPSSAYLQGRFELVLKKIQTHFAHEEEYMRHSGYPKAGPHDRDHAKLIARLKELLATSNFASGTEHADIAPLQQFFSETMPTHIVEFDEGFGLYLNSKGIR
jgi:hemerythrin-like metal-binding protein